MHALEASIRSRADGITYLSLARDLDYDTLLSWGEDPQAARTLLGLRDLFFSTASFSAQRAAARDAAAETGHSYAALLAIYSQVKRLKRQSDAISLLLELARTPGDAKKLRSLGRKRVNDIQPRPPRNPGVNVTRRSDGTATLSITASSLDIADLHAHIKTVEDARAVFERGAERPQITTNVVIQLDEFVQLLDGSGQDVELQLTNGGRLTGAELVGRILSDYGYVGLFHPVHGPLNLYRSKRLATWKQRHLAMLENPTCAWPDCRAPAEDCQVHHLQAWAAGGNTNADNLVTLCRYHNSVNDDSPARSRRGRLVRRHGRVVWTPPRRG
ncbi:MULTISPECIES: HNH endonuclease signature motif containing protein [unclassified Corynebacterium]|uniref:HNH endonuclease signature motif containing protein n=1 Tax=unclassified Corynebacterium TaxID=2624378 RepID=UPI0034CFEEBE